MRAEMVDDEVDQMNDKSAMLSGSRQSSKEQQDIPLCGFASIQYYQPYFDVDTNEIRTRLISSLTSFRVCKFYLRFCAYQIIGR